MAGRSADHARVTFRRSSSEALRGHGRPGRHADRGVPLPEPVPPRPADHQLALRLIDFSSDLGEGAGTDAAIMPLVTSANIACGGHAGNETTMREAVELAMKHNVAIGAHPGYPDPERFGRVPLEMEPRALIESVRRQID